MLVRDIMTQDPVSIETSESIDTAIELLNSMDIRHLPVMEQGEYIGMLSDQDMHPIALRQWSRKQDGPPKVGQIVKHDAFFIHPEEHVVELIRTMIDLKYGTIPVLDPINGNLVGIVSYIDVLTACEDLFDF